MLTSQWYREKYLLDRMTFRDLMWAYVLYPSIQIYAVLLACSIVGAVVLFPYFPVSPLRVAGSIVGLCLLIHSWNMLFIGLFYMGDTCIGRHGRQPCGNGFTMITTRIPMICECCLGQAQPPCRRLLWPPSLLG